MMPNKSTNQNMTIVIVANHPGLVLPPPPSHSIARVIENQIHGLQALGHRVLLVGPEDCQINCEVVPVCEKAITLADAPELHAANKILKRVKHVFNDLRSDVDIVNGHSLDIPGMLQTTGFLADCPIRHVTTCHSSIEITNMDYFRRCKNPIISLSFNQRRAFPLLNFVGNVYNGLDPSEFPVVAKPGDYVCFLGRMSKMKQPHLAIHLALRMGLRIKLAGPVDPIFDIDYFQSECVPLFRNKDVDYLGELDMQDKISLLANAKCNLHPTGFRDPCPLVPIEAGYCGTPTLAINRGALSELVEAGITGFLVEDFAEGAFVIEKCFDLNRNEIATRVRSKFTRERMALGYEGIYIDLLAGKVNNDNCRIAQPMLPVDRKKRHFFAEAKKLPLFTVN